ncbi:MAG TPA: fibronectin type III domain-containing protein [Verrucomicrobiae bacterium]|nr:fibronectin type III domain-containing protein [Verrucomicrobiae bacterium]
MLMLWLRWCVPTQGSQSVTLGWNASPASSVSGYVLYYGIASRIYTNRIDVGTNTAITVASLKEGSTYYFALTAYNSARVESAPSGEIVYIAPGILALVPGLNPADPLNIQFPVAPGYSYMIQASVDLKSWTNIWQTATATSNAWVGFQDSQSGAFPKRFYRLIINSNAPAAPPQLSIAGKAAVPTLASTQWLLSSPAASGETYLLQWSTNLTNWSSMYTNPAGQALSFVDNPPSAQSWRYYRSLFIVGTVNATSIANALASNHFVPNVVGFVNVSAPPGFSLIANPFNTTNNTLAALLPGVPNGSRLAKYIIGQGYVTNVFSGGVWNAGVTTLNPGEGGFFGNPTQTNLPLAFLGQVLQGKLTNSLPAGNSICAPIIPLASALSTLPANNNDTVQCYVNGKWTTYTSILGIWSGTPALTFIPGGAFLMNKSSAANWIESFSIGD